MAYQEPQGFKKEVTYLPRLPHSYSKWPEPRVLSAAVLPQRTGFNHVQPHLTLCLRGEHFQNGAASLVCFHFSANSAVPPQYHFFLPYSTPYLPHPSTIIQGYTTIPGLENISMLVKLNQSKPAERRNRDTLASHKQTILRALLML